MNFDIESMAKYVLPLIGINLFMSFIKNIYLYPVFPFLCNIAISMLGFSKSVDYMYVF